jgi:predicted ATPase/DNA-binding NarL/FixJ family response regulator
MRVLVAEDNPTQRLALSLAVESLGHDCMLATDGAEAWALLQEHGADVLISDWVMPGLTGPELCQRVRSRIGAPYTYVILLTVLDDREHTRFGMQAGADDYLAKPLQIDELELRLIAAARVTDLHRQLSTRAAEREAVLHLARRLPAEGDPEQLLSGLLAEAAVLLGGTAGIVSLWDEEHGVLVPLRNTIPTTAGDARPAAGQAASARAVERRAPVLLNDYQREADDTEVGALAAVAAPLIYDERLLGIIAVVSQVTGKVFTPADAEVLHQLAGIGAAALVGLDRARVQGALQAMQSLDRESLAGGRAAPQPGWARHLPAQPTPLIGRAAELEEATALVLQPGVSLVTLVGPAGVGKTRLAVAAASRVAEEVGHGARFVDLAQVTHPAGVIPMIGATLGLSEHASIESLRLALDGQPLLLIVDNFEHVLDAADDISGLIAACPTLKLLVTSRAALRLRMEHVLSVSPLALPDAGGPLDAATVAQYPSVTLFVERAQAARVDFVLTDDNAQAIAEICAQLDGLPLAIELAAARAALLSPETMRARLEQGLGAVPSGSRDLPERQQTLREAIAWSYALLDSLDQTLFRRLAVFAGGLTLDAVVFVMATGPNPLESKGEWDVLEGLTSLVHKNLLVPDTQARNEPRFHLLETIRQYAREQLEVRGELEATARQHATYFLQLAERAEGELLGSNQTEWLDRLEAESDNLRAALRLVAELEDPGPELRLAAALDRFWYLRGYLDEGKAAIDHALDRASAVHAPLTARLLAGAARFAGAFGDWSTARALLESSLAAWTDVTDPVARIEVVGQLALAHQRAGNRAQALALARENAKHAADLADRRALACALEVLGEVTVSQGNYLRARSHFADCLALAHTDGARSVVATCLEGLAVVSAARGASERAVRIAAAATRLRDEVRIPLDPTRRDFLDRRLASARAALDDKRRAVAWADGYAFTVQQAITHALEEKKPVVADFSQPATEASELQWLTQRERQVAALVAEGLRNQQIADRLGISPNTVEVHMTRILGKLQLPSRAQLAIWALQRGLLRARQ